MTSKWTTQWISLKNQTVTSQNSQTKTGLLRKIGEKDKYNKKTRSGEFIVINHSEFGHDDGDDNGDKFAMDIN